MMKVFSTREFLPAEVYPNPIFYPLWPELHHQKLYGWKSPYDEYIDHPPCFELSSLEDSNVAVLPFDWKWIRGESWHDRSNRKAEKLATRFFELVESVEKPLAIFFGGDCSSETLQVNLQSKNTIIFRQSSYRSRPSITNDPVFPFFCEDFTKEYCQGQLRLRDKKERPRVGFCGFARPINWRRQVQTLAYRAYMFSVQQKHDSSPYVGEELRIASLKSLAESEQVETNFLIRDRSVFLAAQSYEDKQRVREEYVENILDSDYVLCCRGSGNYSHRLYEVLSCGRIPIFVNTDCRLPWEGLINWKDYCIWIEEEELGQIAEKVAEFHNRLSKDEFMRLQLRCRELWLNWLSPQGYFSNFHRFFSLEENHHETAMTSASL